MNRKKVNNIHPSVFIASGAVLTGDVRIRENASVWYNCVLRGDIQPIEIGERTNIQDGSVIHVDYTLPCIIGRDVVVGHGAILHGCTIEDGCLIGMGAIVLSGAVIKMGSVIAAGALIRENMIVEPYSLMAGVPAKKVREDKGYYEKNLRHAEEYVRLAREHMKNHP